MKILAIETSCDETAAAIVEDGTKLIASTIATSKELHEKTGGIVPEVAARKQVESIVPVIEDCLEKAELSLEDIDKLAVTVGPGLVGSLVVGIAAAKSLALVLEKPLIPVNHLVGHIYANWIDVDKAPEFPALVLIVSGGHTDLVLMKDHGKLEFLGGTLDDAAGEAFDKTARLLGIKKYLGGPELSKISASCEVNNIQGVLPRPKIKDEDYDFSFSGLKTAVKRIAEKGNYELESLANEFETAVVDVLVTKAIKAAEQYKVKSILLGGGVAANTQLRSRLKFEAEKLNVSVHIPEIAFCTDNAIYIASAAYFNQTEKDIKELQVDSSLGIMDMV
ncbi:tRNA (adenosine(37)-N6)-threonylcarbamoyltransferase complex transferase subunit TsaD [candidate division WWE3 bacterium]|jgi:N6-L-threonylcarbamoyladenine synthase|nr:tRNA (adenosine(37)-N6)-threonylcarbamoyltransferase complex transferase subunit TsaD [candidate division WWE3 bacterium]MBT7350296.1 tRNA (adenosine(37)-N6)-threonylcarbamoyltransferase complex transferase subunit TsaD [candidate division WWE3 bacterium]